MRLGIFSFSMLIGSLVLGQPTGARAEGNPFRKTPIGVTAPSATPVSPVRDVVPFEQAVGDFIASYQPEDPDNPAYIDSLREISTQVFSNPGSTDYIDKLTYIDGMRYASPRAVEMIANTLQARWAAAYGMLLDPHLLLKDSGQPHKSLADRRSERVRIGEDSGALTGTALALLSLALTRNPRAISAYFAVFRAVLPAVGYVGGTWIGHESAQALNRSGFFERGVPLAPAHVMHLGVDQDDFAKNEDTLVKQLVPLVIGIGAGNAVLAATETADVAKMVLSAVRAFRTAGLAAAGAEIEFPPAMIASIVVTIVVERAVTYGIEAWQYDSLKSDLTEARKKVDLAVSSGDTVALYRSADELVARSLNLYAYINHPIVQSNLEFQKNLAKAMKDHPEGSSELQAEVTRLSRELDAHVREAMEDQDQGADADYQAYVALKALETQGPEVLDACLIGLESLPPIARERTRAYFDAFAGFQKGFDRYLVQTEQRLGQSLSPLGREQAKGAYYAQFLALMRSAKDRQLAGELRAGRIARHAGHVLLQTVALLSSTGDSYVQSKADSLMRLIEDGEKSTRLLSGGGLN